MGKEIKLLNKIKDLLKKAKIPKWLHHFGPKTYDFSQHTFALLLKEACKLSFRRVSNILNELGIKVPTYSALCKVRKRIPLSIWSKLLKMTVNFESSLVAVDSTGFSRSNPSWHYIRRIDKKKPVNSYVKLSSFFDVKRRKFLALKIRSKPRHDIMDIPSLFNQRKKMDVLLGDTAYDAESLHERAFYSGITTIIKPRKNVRKGFFRKKQMKKYSEKVYHQRSLIESGFGSLKRKYGSYVLARAISAQRAEIYCRAIAHNLNIENKKTFN